MTRTLWFVVGVVAAVIAALAVYVFVVPHAPAGVSPDKMRKVETLGPAHVTRVTLPAPQQ